MPKLQLEAIIEEVLKHGEHVVDRGSGRGFGENLKSDILVFSPVRARDLLVAGEAVGVAEAIGEGAVGERNRTVPGMSEVAV